MAFTADEAFSLLAASHANNRLAHAYLITGPEGSGTRELALRLTGLIVGRREKPLSHPDVHTAEPESKSRRIVVEQMRDMERQLQMCSSAGGRKVAVIFDADRLQEQAANAFLKTLEEPPPGSHLLLVTSNPDQLLETVVSRCIEVTLKPVARREPGPLQIRLLDRLRAFSTIALPTLPQALTLVREFQALLAEAKEAITGHTEAALKAEVKLYKQATDATGAWFESREEYYKALTEARYRNERSALIETLEQWWADILRQQHGGQFLDHPASAAETAAVARRLPLAEVLRRADAIAGLRVNSNRNVNETLALEVAFIEAYAA